MSLAAFCTEERIVPPARDKLNVTFTGGIDDWRAYVVLNGRAVIVATGCLNDLRYYAEREGYTGILIGAPSVPWATIKTI